MRAWERLKKLMSLLLPPLPRPHSNLEKNQTTLSKCIFLISIQFQRILRESPRFLFRAACRAKVFRLEFNSWAGGWKRIRCFGWERKWRSFNKKSHYDAEFFKYV